MPTLKPPMLVRGDKIAAITPSWGGPAIFRERYEKGLRRIKDIFGLEVVAMPHTLATPEHLAQHPEDRAADLLAAFVDPTIKGIFATIGGDDAVKLLPYIDYDIMKKHPKIVLGFSDTTVLHFMCLKAGITSFYGPSIMCEFAENVAIPAYSFASLNQHLFSRHPAGAITASVEWTDEYLEWGEATQAHLCKHWQPAATWNFLQGEGSVTGHLLGGCVETLLGLVNTDVWPDLATWQGALFFIELSELKASPDEFQHMLEALAATGLFAVINGLLFGHPGQFEQQSAMHQHYEQVLKKVCHAVGRPSLPIISRMNFGHTIPTFVIPYGVSATLDFTNKTMSITESACSPRTVSSDHTKKNAYYYNLNCALEHKLALLSAANTNNKYIIERLFQDHRPDEQKKLAATVSTVLAHADEQKTQLFAPYRQRASLTGFFATNTSAKESENEKIPPTLKLNF